MVDTSRIDAALALADHMGRRLDAVERLDAMARLDADWKEGDHPRAEDGKFGAGGGGVSSGSDHKTTMKAATERDRVATDNYLKMRREAREITDPKAALKFENKPENRAIEREFFAAGREKAAAQKSAKEAQKAAKPPSASKEPALKSGTPASPVKSLKEKLNSVAKGGLVGSGQAENDPDLDYIVKNGKGWTSGHLANEDYLGTDGQCHWNTARLFLDGKAKSIVVGYAKNHQGWHQHTWGLDAAGKVIETTEENLINTDWFGAPLDEAESKAFAEHVLKKGSEPGQGNVRTKKGGHVIGVERKG